MEKTIYRCPRVVEITRGWNFSYKVSQYHEQLTLILSLFYLTFYIRLPELKNYDWDNWDRGWGVYWHDRSFWVCWGKKTKGFYAPWSWEHVRHEVLFYPEGLRKPPGEPWDINDGRHVEKHPYTCTLKSGQKQSRTATVYVEEREWRWKWFTWLPWPRKVDRSICVEFDREVGERSGTWKGGCIGCGYKMLPGETIAQAIRRMEAERVFD